MLRSLNVLYETLYNLIRTEFGGEFLQLDRGFRYTRDCMKDMRKFPYAFLDQPETSDIEPVKSPAVYEYTVQIDLVILSKSADDERLFFSENAETGKKDAVELAQLVAGTLFRRYVGGFNFNPSSTEWRISKWRLGRIVRPRLTELNNYFDFPNIAGASIPFIFTIHEQGSFPGGRR